MKRIFLTGAAGFIGSFLCDVLIGREDRVYGYDNFSGFYSAEIKRSNLSSAMKSDRFSLIEGDIRDTESLLSAMKESRADVVVHLAAQAGVRPSIENPNEYQSVNVIGTQNVLDAARACGVSHLVMASSSSVYGEIREMPLREDMNINAVVSPYAATKRMNELMAHVHHHLYGQPVTMLRFFTAYGPRQRPDMAISKFSRLILEGKPLQMYGDGTTRRDYTYIEDIVDGVVRAIDTPLGFEILNLGGARTTELRALISMLGDALGEKPLIEYLPMQPGDVTDTFADISKARALLGYEPNTPIEAGIEKYVGWLRDFGSQAKVAVSR